MDYDNRINPQLFVTCRLCVEATGQYQIVPQVQEQIRYCFDIQVENYDGLSQVICRKCKEILANYFTLKNKFNENQKKLLVLKSEEVEDDQEQEQVQEKNSVENNNVSSDDSLPIATTTKKSKKRIYKRILSSESASSADISVQKNIVSIKDLKKLYVCRFCTKQTKSFKNVKKHYCKHDNLIAMLKKYTNINKYCSVPLNKIDYETSKNNKILQLNHNEIIGNEGNNYYFIKYMTLEKYDEQQQLKAKRKVNDETSDSSLNDVRQNRKKARHASNSSEGTIVTEDCKTSHSDTKESKYNKLALSVVNAEELCIEVDDSSSESGVVTTTKQKKPYFKCKNLQDIHFLNITFYNKCMHTDKRKVIGPDNDTILDKKLLSIGTKIMSTKGYVSLGLLKYLACKFLLVKWLSLTLLRHKDINKTYVRIVTKKKNNESKVTEIYCWDFLIDTNKTYDIDKIPMLKELEPLVPASIEPTQSILTNAVSKSLFTDSAVISPITNSNHGNKLLNASPVTNPKKLPKKIGGVDIKPVTVTSNTVNKESKKTTFESILIESDDETNQEHHDKTNQEQTAELDQDQNDIENMPVITSVLSLATPEQSSKFQSSSEVLSSTDNKQSYAPRIKCKPVSELMAPRDMPSLNGSVSVPSSSVACNNNQEDISIVLNTVEIPNKTTSSPIQYLKTLLQMHSLVLHTRTNFEISKDFISLIKYTYQITCKKEITFGIELFVHINEFYLRFQNISDRVSKIDIEELTVSWQMLLIQSFYGDVTNKIRQNSKKLPVPVRDNTRRFLSLLQSIEEKQQV